MVVLNMALAIPGLVALSVLFTTLLKVARIKYPALLKGQVSTGLYNSHRRKEMPSLVCRVHQATPPDGLLVVRGRLLG